MLTRRRRLVIPLALAAAATVTISACGSSGGSKTGSSTSTTPATGNSSAAGSSTGAPAASGSASASVPASAYETRVTKNAQTTVDTTKYKKTAPYTIGVIPQGPINGWGTMFNLTIEYELKQSGKVKQVLLTNPQGDPAKQISQMQTMIVQKPDVIILTPLSEAGLSAPVERAMAAGIPVVLCGSSVINTDNYVTASERNLYEVAYDSANKLAQMLGGKGNVMMLNGISGSGTATTWHDAATAAFAQYPGIKIVADQYANWSISLAKTKAAAIIAANPKIDGVWTGGSENAIGAVEAFADAGRPMPLFGTTNPLNGFLRLAKQYNLQFVAAPYPPEVSKLCADLALDILAGKPVKKYVDMTTLNIPGVDPYTQAELDSHYQPKYNDDFIAPAVIPDSELTSFLAK